MAQVVREATKQEQKLFDVIRDEVETAAASGGYATAVDRIFQYAVAWERYPYPSDDEDVKGSECSH